jgi:hypothetical protein
MGGPSLNVSEFSFVSTAAQGETFAALLHELPESILRALPRRAAPRRQRPNS